MKPSIWFIFALVLIDMLGFGIVMPVLPMLIMQVGHMSVDSAALWAGWLTAGYAAMQFLFAPVLGNLSDRFGRRPILLASILAFAVDYCLMGFAPNLSWLVIGRIIAGLTGASFSAAYAYIADISKPEDRAASFGVLGMAFGFGFIIGPALGGFAGEFGARVPFFLAAGLGFANFVFGLFFLKESLAKDNRRAFSIARANAFGALRNLAGQSRKVLWFVGALGVWQLAHLVYPAIWAYFAIEAYGWDQWQIGLSLTVVGIGSALVQGLGLRYLQPRIGEVRAVMLGVAAVVAVSLVYAFVRWDPAIYAALLLGGLQGLIQPSIAALNSRAVDASSQGELQGATQAIASLAAIIGPPIYAGIFAKFVGANAPFVFPAMPLILSAGFALIALALFLIGAREQQRDQTNS